MSKRKIGVYVLLGLCIALAPSLVSAALGPHDVTATSGGQEGACAECHNRGAGSPATRGWSKALGGAPTGNPEDWESQSITPLCWSCHNTSGGVDANDIVPTALNTNNHKPAILNAAHDVARSVTTRGVDNVRNSGLPYVTATYGDYMQCTSCHNVHNNLHRPFMLAAPASNLSGMGALCDKCHPGRINTSVGTANDLAGNTFGASSNYSTHPVGVAFSNIAANGPTNLETSMNGNLARTMGAEGSYTLGGKLTIADAPTPASNISCETCHAVHGMWAAANTNTEDYLALNNYAQSYVDNNALCEGCHGGGKTPGAASTYTVGTGSDHPIDNGVGRSGFYPTSTALPGDWTASSSRVDTYAALFTASSNGVPRCSSCHDTHGGLAQTSILRGPIPTQPGSESSSTGNTQWCWSCHWTSRVAPALHHSNNSTYASSLIACKGCHGEVNAAANYAAQEWPAHNGFGEFVASPDASDGTADTGATFNNTTANSTTFQRLCEECHDPADPTTFQGGLQSDGSDLTGATATWPARHGNATGTQTHLVSDLTNGYFVRDEADGTRTYNSYNRIGTATNDNTNWGTVDADVSNYADNNIVSKFANYGNGDPWDPQTPASAYVVCESCHNLLTNAGPSDAADCVASGYYSNLLVYLYEDDGSGVKSGEPVNGPGGDGLCRGCHSSTRLTVTELSNPPVAKAYVHYPEAHTTDTTNYQYPTAPYGRTDNTIITTYSSGSCPNTSTADNIVTGTMKMSIPATDELNCDSCHRPHNADANGNNGFTDLASGNNSSVGFYILEDGSVAADNMAKTQACIQCHYDRSVSQWQCF